MLPNKDRSARSAQGRFFPVTVAETLALIRELRFAAPPYRKRIDVIFQNPDTDSKLGSYVARSRRNSLNCGQALWFEQLFSPFLRSTKGLSPTGIGDRSLCSGHTGPD